jgi:hypothetical protein
LVDKRRFRTRPPEGWEPPERLETWPEVPVAPLPVGRAFGVSTDASGWLVYSWDENQEAAEFEELPDELVLRGLLKLDPTDTESVLGFLDEFGVIQARYLPSELAPLDLPLLRLGQPPAGARNHLYDAQAYLATARALSKHWAAHCEGREVAPAWREEGCIFPELVMADEMAWNYFSRCLNHGLRVFTMRLQYMGHSVPHPDLYQALCFQLMNLIIDELPPRKCANENCPQYFVRQQGRSQHGQSRTRAVKYCQPSCASAKGQRDRRRRKIRNGSDVGR